MAIEIRGARVRLRAFRPDELDVVIEHRRQGAASSATIDRERLRQRHEHSGAWHEDRLDLAVEVDGELVGEVDVRTGRRMVPPGVCELGIELWAERRAAGLGTDAIGALTTWLHANGFPRVQGGTDVGNASMRRVFEKVGFEAEGVMRAFMPVGDGRADYVLYAHVER